MRSSSNNPYLSALLLLAPVGCTDVLPPVPSPLFVVPLEIEGRSVGQAIIDTGGEYEVLLRDAFDLQIAGNVEVLVFGGRESVRYTEGFPYSVAGFEAFADGAIVGISSCDCNGIGVHFFRKTGAVVALAFSQSTASFVSAAPQGGIVIPFQGPPAFLNDFRSSFLEVQVESNGGTRTVRALLDTGSTQTLLKRGVFDLTPDPVLGRLRINLARDELGIVSVSAALFDNDELPDLIIGTDVMRAWGDRWFFHFAPHGGSMTVFPNEESGTDDGQVFAKDRETSP